MCECGFSEIKSKKEYIDAINGTLCAHIIEAFFLHTFCSHYCKFTTE